MSVFSERSTDIGRAAAHLHLRPQSECGASFVHLAAWATAVADGGGAGGLRFANSLRDEG